MADLQKLDTPLFIAYQAYQESHDKDPEDGISISLRFDGDIAPIEALGFQTYRVLGNEALGAVRFQDIEALDAHPSVLWMEAGQAPQLRLDTAAEDIKARAPALNVTTGKPVGGLWFAREETGDFASLPDATGKDVFIGIIDTGIDYKHPMFMSDLGPPKKKTRIFRIWDQGLLPAVVEEGPDAKKYLLSGDTYGVEYKQEEIDSALNGGAQINHKDCVGHGTHVAGIAAGGTKFPKGGDAKFVGVAPEASLIVVKYFDNPAPIRYRLQTGFGKKVGDLPRFRDSVLYCLEVAKEAKKPVVINMSFGDNSLPGDGLDPKSTFCDLLMDPSRPETGILAYPKGSIVVMSGGNEGDLRDRQTAHIVVPPSGEITVPLELKDARHGETDTWLMCDHQLYKPPIGVHFWYRRATQFNSVKFALRLPDQDGFSGDMHVGGNLSVGFIPKAGPPPPPEPKIKLVSPAPNVHRAFVRHEANPENTEHPRAAFVWRHRVEFWVEPKESGGSIFYHSGIYEMRIKAPAGTVIYAMCDQQFWGAKGLAVTFEIAKTMMDPTLPLDSGIKLTNKSSLTDTLGQHVITVAAYDDKNGGGGADQGKIASFSSRGPLRDFSNPPEGPIAVKPDIAAPGVAIMSADGLDTEPPLPPAKRTPEWVAGVRFAEHQGTSQAAPMVAGVIALLLDKKPDMNITEVRKALHDGAGAAVDPATPPDSTEAYGGGRVDALKSHKTL